MAVARIRFEPSDAHPFPPLVAFRLRTMLIVVAALAIPLAWVGYSLNWIRQRHEVLYSNFALGVAMPRSICGASCPNAPWMLRPFGELGQWKMIHCALPSNIEAERRRLAALFPEAEIEVSEVPPELRSRFP